ncbi:TerB family tellurite resistance protein [Paracoccus sp. S-4012]|uniref:tellurite resistance TerB family protein n=1 Tax=Paracoccus sp. S-4012 TaxID=2665648 RepID=UPI0012AF81E8|nr:TerB family tellurite resistance protein [Paracoccus sp. S-4012]MRX49200.1 TerB family tellurite resistance protein [Paracoccus sp. S-4012]
MFRNLLSRLLSDDADAAALSPGDADLAIAALLVRVARSDDHYTRLERALIDEILARRGGFDSVEAADRRAAAEMIEAEAPDTVRLTRRIKEFVPLEERIEIIASMWEVVYSDGHRHAEEEAMVRLAAGLIGVNDRDSNLARQAVLARQDEA